MPIPLVVGGNTYLYSENMENAPWGEENTAWAVAVTNVLSEVQGTGDIEQTIASIGNNIISSTNVAGLVFSSLTTRGAVVEYTVYRVTSGSGASEAVEVGTMYPGYLSVANTWEMPVIGGQNSGVVFTINNNGQVQYTSSALTGSSYSGTITFRARALLQ